jgi:cysteine desulfurase
MAVYLDNNATTPLRPEVWEAMAHVEFGPHMLRNPSSLHVAGVAAQRAVAAARAQIAASVGAAPDEVVFTGGGSEAINLAIKGAVWGSRIAMPHAISTTIEHHAVLHALDWLRSTGVATTLVPADSRGVVDPAAIADAMGEWTVLVSVMHVNNETGAIQPVEEIGAICRERGVLFHVDAVQAVGKLPVDVRQIGCDLLSCSAHKLGGPKGVGALIVRAGTPLVPLVHGGSQERGLRAGTENAQGIVGFATAVALAESERERNWAHWLSLRPILYRLLDDIPDVRLNSDPDSTVPNCVNLSFAGCDGMNLAMNLSAKGVYVSTGSACTAGDVAPSHVLKAMDLTDDEAKSALRFSMGASTTAAEVERAAETTRAIVERLRAVNGV